MLNPIRESATVEISGQPFIIKSLQSDLKDLVLRGKGGIERVLDYGEFYNGIAEGVIKIPGYSRERPVRYWEPSEYAEAIYRRDLIKLVGSDKFRRVSKEEQKTLLLEVANEHGKKVPAEKTIKGYQKKFAAGGFEALIPNYHSRGGNGWKAKTELKETVRKSILETYARDDKLNLAATTRKINAILKESCRPGEVIQKISPKMVSRVLYTMPRDVVLNGRVDPRTYRVASRQAVNEFYVEYAFELMQIDAKTIDMYGVDEFGRRFSKMTLYSMICSRTGYPVAIYVTAGAPSEHALLKLFEFFFMPKDQAFKERFELKSDWPAPCGLNKVLLDNASENAAGVALEIVRDLGIDIHYARAFRGDDKPHIESLFSTLEKMVFGLMPGAKKSSEKTIKNRHERAEKEACYTVEDVYKDVVQFIADTYVQEAVVKLGFRHGKRMTIHESLNEELKRFMPPPPPSLEQVQQLILHKHKTIRTVQHYGIDFEGFQYHSYPFAEVAREFPQQQVTILFNPSECLAIYAVHPRTGELIKLDCKMRHVPNVSFEVLKDLRKEYEGDQGIMNGHDYQKAYARLLNKWGKDSQRSKKISDNNRLGQKKALKGFHSEVQTLLDQKAVAPANPTVWPVEQDDEFIPAPREGY